MGNERERILGFPFRVPSHRTGYHHYCKGRVATQFCSFVEKKRQNANEWMATHEDSHFDSFRKLACAVDHYAAEHFKSWVFGGREPVNVEFYYPALVVQGDLLDVPPK